MTNNRLMANILTLPVCFVNVLVCQSAKMFTQSVVHNADWSAVEKDTPNNYLLYTGGTM